MNHIPLHNVGTHRFQVLGCVGKRLLGYMYLLLSFCGAAPVRLHGAYALDPTTSVLLPSELPSIKSIFTTNLGQGEGSR